MGLFTDYFTENRSLGLLFYSR